MMTYREMEEMQNGCFAVVGIVVALIIIVSLL